MPADLVINAAGPRSGRAPTHEELATESGPTVDRIEDLRRLARPRIGLDVPTGEDGTPLGEFVEDTEQTPAP